MTTGVLLVLLILLASPWGEQGEQGEGGGTFSSLALTLKGTTNRDNSSPHRLQDAEALGQGTEPALATTSPSPVKARVTLPPLQHAPVRPAPQPASGPGSIGLAPETLDRLDGH